MTEPQAQGAAQRALAERFVQYVAEQSGEQLDFSPASLAALDALLAEWRDLASVYGGAGPADLSGLAEPVTAYLGEVLIGAFAGAWEATTVVLDGRLRADLAHGVVRSLHGAGGLMAQYQALAARLAGVEG